MSDLKLEALFDFDPVEQARIVAALKNKHIASELSKYVHNMENVALLAALPINLVQNAQLMQTGFCRAFYEVVGNLSCDPPTFFENEQLIIDAWNKHAKQFAEEMRSSEWEKTYNDKIVRDTIQMMGNGSLAQRGSIALLEALLLNTWTAFETLASDLWLSAVNNSPRGLATLTGNGSRIQDLAGGAADTATDQGITDEEVDDEEDLEDEDIDNFAAKKITLGDIHKITRGSFDLREKMGDLLLISGRVKFARLDGIREAYSLAFSEKEKKARTRSIDVSLANKSFDVLALVRNLLIHKSGIADYIYLNEQQCIQSAPKLSLGDRIPVDGALIRSMIEPVITSCVNLVKSVDEWVHLTQRRAKT